MKSLIYTVSRKEILHIIRDKRTLFMLFFLPVFQLIIFGYAVSVDLKHLSTVVLNRDNHNASRELISDFKNSTYFDINYYVLDRHEAEKILDSGKAKVILEIPPDFSKNIKLNRSVQVSLTVDGTDPNPANTAMNTASAITQSFGAKIYFQKTNMQPSVPVDLRARVYYNPDLRSANFMIPGVIGFLLQILIIILTSNTIVKEKEKGTLEVLITTPIKRYELIIGKLVPYIFIAFFDVIMVLSLGLLLFKVEIAGSLILLLSISFLFLCGSLGLGLFISSVAQNQYQAFQLLVPLFPLSVLLSGFIFARDGMPKILYYLGYMVPLTYFLKVLRGIMLKGIGIEYLLPETLALTAYTIFFVALSIFNFKKKLD
ncbi:MAG: ABC transporter permease [Elusimicrobia bacterium]|nr:ABC transporter permease [Elusimicrobiota bacterium]